MWDYHKYLLHTHRSFLILVSICSQTPSAHRSEVSPSDEEIYLQSFSQHSQKIFFPHNFLFVIYLVSLAKDQIPFVHNPWQGQHQLAKVRDTYFFYFQTRLRSEVFSLEKTMFVGLGCTSSSPSFCKRTHGTYKKTSVLTSTSFFPHPLLIHFLGITKVEESDFMVWLAIMKCFLLVLSQPNVDLHASWHKFCKAL